MESNGESVGSLCGVSESKSVGNAMGESRGVRGKSVGSPWGVHGEPFWSCVHTLSVKGSDVWSGEIYLQFAFSLLVAGLGLKAF